MLLLQLYDDAASFLAHVLASSPLQASCSEVVVREEVVREEVAVAVAGGGGRPMVSSIQCHVSGSGRSSSSSSNYVPKPALLVPRDDLRTKPCWRDMKEVLYCPAVPTEP
jgi:hypothetical protein